MVLHALLNKLATLDRWVEHLVKGGLLLAVAGMLLLTLAGTVCRWSGVTFLWMEPLARHLVFLSAFLGGTLAVGAKTHIGIDLLGRVLKTSQNLKGERYLNVLIAGVSTVVCAFLVVAGTSFTQMELESGAEGFLGLQSGWLIAIIPVGVGLISFRFFAQTLLLLRRTGD